VVTRLNGLEFSVEIEGSGPPLLLLHGFTGSMRAWDDVWSDLALSAEVIALDLIGHGRSSAPCDAGRYTLECAAADLESLLDGLGLDSVSLLGYSMGGRLALHFATRHPRRVRRLILESASPGIADLAERQRRMEADTALAQRILDRGVAEFVAEWERQPLLALAPHVAEAVRERQHRQRLDNHALGLANSLRGMGAGRQAPLWDRLGTLTLPVTLLVGESDIRYREIAMRMAGLLPRADLAVIDGAGHTVHVDQPAAFARVVKNTLL
jgi:2-succinyl-6-hydroxy-2,4-cyclohexadiene-1-carboxylate synthase